MALSSENGKPAGAVTHAWGLASSALTTWLSELKLDPPADALVEQRAGQANLRVTRIVCDDGGGLRLLGAGETASDVVALPPARGAWAAGEERGVRSLYLLGAGFDEYAAVRFSQPIVPPRLGR